MTHGLSAGGGAPRDLAHPRQSPREQTRFFTVEEVAEILNVCTRTVRRRIDRKKLIAHHFDGIVRIAESDLRDFIAQHRCT